MCFSLSKAKFTHYVEIHFKYLPPFIMNEYFVLTLCVCVCVKFFSCRSILFLLFGAEKWYVSCHLSQLVTKTLLLWEIQCMLGRNLWCHLGKLNTKSFHVSLQGLPLLRIWNNFVCSTLILDLPKKLAHSKIRFQDLKLFDSKI